MKRFSHVNLLVALMSTLFAFPAQAQVSVKDAWVRATVPAQTVTGAFMKISATQDSRLVAVKSNVAGMVELHEMTMDKDVMSMRALPDGLALPAGKTIELKPGGYHVMLMGLKQTMKAGDTVPLTLVIEGKDKKRVMLDITANVKPLAGAGATADMPMH